MKKFEWIWYVLAILWFIIVVSTIFEPKVATLIIIAPIVLGGIWVAWLMAKGKQEMDDEYHQWRLTRIDEYKRKGLNDPDLSWGRFIDERRIEDSKAKERES